jgi:hypothetical protein
MASLEHDLNMSELTSCLPFLIMVCRANVVAQNRHYSHCVWIGPQWGRRLALLLLALDWEMLRGDCVPCAAETPAFSFVLPGLNLLEFCSRSLDTISLSYMPTQSEKVDFILTLSDPGIKLR